MEKIICNPLNLSYRYQHCITSEKWSYYREGADPTLVYFKDRYYLFASMSAGFWHSTDLIHWQFHENKNLLIHDYAPDARQIGDYLYFCASKRDENCPILRTKDPLSDQFEEVARPFPFWDPDLFCDDDGRVYLYWGCSNKEPIYGLELNPDLMTPITEKVVLLQGEPAAHGFERVGEDCNPLKRSGPFQHLGSDPYIEGAFMSKHNGRYYLQYAVPGTEFNTYTDGVYISDHPLGPFVFASHNPFSSKPGGFITAAGHGSTIQDRYGNWWHAATMRISVNHPFERRVGLFPAGFDEDGILFCNQNFADYPLAIPEGKFDPWEVGPKWMLLSYHKQVTCSSAQPGHGPELAVDENIRTWWSAASNRPGEYLQLDLGDIYSVHAIQVNLADDGIPPQKHAEGEMVGDRYIETEKLYTRYLVEGSLDGKQWFVLEDKRDAECDLPHDLFIYREGKELRYIKVTGYEFPYGQSFKVSGLRVFGEGKGQKPAQVKAKARRTGDLNALIQWNRVEDAQGYNVRYGTHPEKLYSSWLVYDQEQLDLPTLNKGMTYYVCVDSFNESGITPGKTIRIEE
ncbi:MAG: family 43 glycosylhydrolase [Chloroflexi bacterium]|nr:family 43 glycosylhydrolase [Chloroflexota bacterium]